MNIVEWDKLKDADIFSKLGFKGDMFQVEQAVKAAVFLVLENNKEFIAFDLRGEIGWPGPTARCVTPWVSQETLTQGAAAVAAHGYITLGIPVNPKQEEPAKAEA